jgi:hypothetical protein
MSLLSFTCDETTGQSECAVSIVYMEHAEYLSSEPVNEAIQMHEALLQSRGFQRLDTGRYPFFVLSLRRNLPSRGLSARVCTKFPFIPIDKDIHDSFT